jgi:uncharacterized protein YabN with tetrapyrrole methylase and pyrophosphatase domain
LTGEQKQWLATSQINLGEIKQNENITVKVYGDRTFLREVHKVWAVSKDDAMTVVSHAMPDSDSLRNDEPGKNTAICLFFFFLTA